MRNPVIVVYFSFLKKPVRLSLPDRFLQFPALAALPADTSIGSLATLL